MAKKIVTPKKETRKCATCGKEIKTVVLRQCDKCIEARKGL